MNGHLHKLSEKALEHILSFTTTNYDAINQDDFTFGKDRGQKACCPGTYMP